MVSDATKKQMLRDIYRIRFFEEKLKDLYSYTGFYGDGTMVSEARTVEDMLTCVMYDFEKSGLIGGAVHLYIGEEAVAVGVCTALRDTDWVTSYHRGHGHALAKGLGFDGMMAELLGREVASRAIRAAAAALCISTTPNTGCSAETGLSARSYRLHWGRPSRPGTGARMASRWLSWATGPPTRGPSMSR